MKKSVTLLIGLSLSLSLLTFVNKSYADIHLPSHHYYIASTASKLTPTRKLDISALLKDNLYVAVQEVDSGKIRYTHAGVFWLDTDGYFYQDGGRLQGYPMPESLTRSDCKLTDLKAPASKIMAKATDNVLLALNLDAGSVIAASPFEPNNQATYNYQTQTSIMDSLGKTYNLSLYFIKLGINEWGVAVVVDGALIGKGIANFSTSGQLSQVSGLSALLFNPTGGSTSPQVFNVDLSGSTQYAGKNEIRLIQQNGATPADATGEVVDENGYVAEHYTDGQSIVFGKLAITEAK